MGTILVLAVLAGAVGLIVRGMLRDKRQGKACGGCSGCAGCHLQGDCASKKGKCSC